MRSAGAVRPNFLNRKIGFGFLSARAAFYSAAFPVASALALGVVLTLAVPFIVAPSASAQDDIASRRASAQDQFERAEMQRAALEAKPERERSVRDYEDLVSAY